MAQLDRDQLLLSVFVAVEGAHAFSAFMPSSFTVKKFAQDDGDAARLRSGYVPAVIFNAVLSGSVSALINSPLPLMAAAIVTVFMIGLYEYQMRESVI